jgi:hypothetical protein
MSVFSLQISASGVTMEAIYGHVAILDQSTSTETMFVFGGLQFSNGLQQYTYTLDVHTYTWSVSLPFYAAFDPIVFVSSVSICLISRHPVLLTQYARVFALLTPIFFHKICVVFEISSLVYYFVFCQ